MIKRLLCVGILIAVKAFFPAPTVLAQTADGSIPIQAVDATKALVPGTHLVLSNIETSAAPKARRSVPAPLPSKFCRRTTQQNCSIDAQAKP